MLCGRIRQHKCPQYAHQLLPIVMDLLSRQDDSLQVRSLILCDVIMGHHVMSLWEPVVKQEIKSFDKNVSSKSTKFSVQILKH